jgi:UDP-N-acetyl-D-glucosamine dehydrogenase
VTVEPIAALRDTLLRRIDTHEVYIGIIGQGYVGVPLALTFADKGFRVLGFDVDAEKVAALNRGECYIRHVDSVRLRRARET